MQSERANPGARAILPEIIGREDLTFHDVKDGRVGGFVVVDPLRLPELMPSAVARPLTSSTVPSDGRTRLVVEAGSEKYGISVGEPGGRPVEPAFSFPDDIYRRFLSGDLRQRESRSLDNVALLERIILGGRPGEIGKALSIDERNHTRLLAGDIIGDLVRSHPGRERDVEAAYERFAYPFITRVYEEVRDPHGSRKQMPFGSFNGLQGRANGRMLTRYALEGKMDIGLDHLRVHVCSGEFDAAFFKEAGLESMLVSVYSNSPSEAMIDYLTNHPERRYRVIFAGLRSYHFPNVNNQWTMSGDGAERMDAGWEYDGGKGVWRNLGNARRAVGELVDVLMGNPRGKPMPLNDYLKGAETVVRTITDETMDTTSIRHGGNFGGLRMGAYSGHNDHAIMDFLGHHWDPRVRKHFSGLREYHFVQGASWNLPDGGKNYTLAREAIGELTEALAKERGIRIDMLPREISQDLAHDTKIRYGATVGGMFDKVYGSHVLGYIDFLRHHPHEQVRGIFRDIDVYHFQDPPKGTWTRKEPPQDTTGWVRTGEGEDEVWRNAGLAHKAFSELVDVLTKPEGGYRWPLRKVFRDMTFSTMKETGIKYGATCSQALAMVYEDLIDVAVGDYIASPRFKTLVEGVPYLMSQTGHMGWARFKEDLFELERGKSGIRKPDDYKLTPAEEAGYRLALEFRGKTPEEIRRLQNEAVWESLTDEERRDITLARDAARRRGNRR
jgi:hypothetical protein